MAQNDNCQLAGIDFGACNLKAVKLAGRTVRPMKLNKDDMGGNELPNFLYYNKLKDGSIEQWVGKKARDKTILDAENGIGGIKRKLQLEFWHKYIPNLEREISSVEAASHTLAAIKRAILKGQKEPVAAVLTVPVCYTAQQTGRIAKASEMAGIDLKGFISESFAAIFALKNLEDHADGLTVILDMGGSTLDISIVRVAKQDDRLEIEELVTGGLPLGGLDLDRLIYDEILLPRHEKEIQEHWPGEPDVSRAILLQHASKHKENIYLDDEESVLMAIGPDIELYRADIEKIIQSPAFGGRILALLDSLFDKLEENMNGYGIQDVRHVIPLGGCMRIPVLVKLLEDYFGKGTFDSETFDFEETGDFADGLESRYEVVAAGAARYLDLLLNKPDKIAISRVAPFDFGYLSEGKFECCIASNMPHSFKGGYRVLGRSELEQNNWELSIYQTYPDAEMPDPVFVDAIQLDRALYSPAPVLFRMSTGREGDIRLEVFQENGNDAEDALKLVEEHIIRPGGV